MGVVSSGAQRVSASGSVRDSDAGKGRPSLMSPHGILGLAIHYANGAAKYGDRNWEIGQPISWYIDAIDRHSLKLKANCHDENHAMAIAWNAIAIEHTRQMIRRGLADPALDDVRSFPSHDGVNRIPSSAFLPYEFEFPGILPIVESWVKENGHHGIHAASLRGWDELSEFVMGIPGVRDHIESEREARKATRQ